VHQRIELLGVAFVVYGGVLLAAAAATICVCLAFAGALVARGLHDEQMMMAAMFYVGSAALAALLGALLGLPCVVVGTGLRLRRPWARAGGLVCAAMTVSHLPLGTALGVCAFAVLLDPRALAALDGP
jgi:hypothetical protein